MVTFLAPQTARANWLEDVGNDIASVFGVSAQSDSAETYATGTPVADTLTINDWEGYADESLSTSNVGRIWTDKSVSADDITLEGTIGDQGKISKGDSDFLVGLSALSSTSNLTTTSAKPLDIVLVLDTSGSMDNSMGEAKYHATTYVRESSGWTSAPTYYVKQGDRYVKVTEDRRNDGWLLFPDWTHISWEVDGREVEPKTASNPDGVQFYTYSSAKLDALKDAVNNFIDMTARENEALSDDSKHRISIVKYASSADISSDLVSVEGEDVSTLHHIVDSLSADGSTGADYAFDTTGRVLNSSREEAQKVVIFFTDGEPNHGNGFDNEVAASTVNKSKSIKDGDTLVYSVGVFDGANPNDTNSDFNKYMNAVSSNYPKATASSGYGFNVNFGDRADADKQYYKAATDSDELNQIFQDIFKDVQSVAAGSPTQVVEGGGYDQTKSGYITFTDTLGDYMEVNLDRGVTVVYANQQYTCTNVTDNGSTKVFQFDRSTSDVGGNGVYESGNLADLIIEVTPGSTAQKGDTITVKIPASLIPCRKYVVTNEDGTVAMNVEGAYPIRVFYGVNLKDDAAALLANPDEAMTAYINTHKDEDGTIAFYSNKYESGTTGTTTAEFTPSSTNSFYYYTQNTTLYTDPECTSALKKYPDTSGNTTYYYKQTSYVEEDGVAQAKEERIAISGDLSAITAGEIGKAQDGSYYVKKGAKRLSRASHFAKDKSGNETGTATKAISPTWSGSDISVKLGNNGKLPVELPGTLEVSKTVEVGDGLKLDDYKDESFKFTISVPEAKGQSFEAVVKNAQGEVRGDESFSVTFDENGAYTHSLKHGETLYIYGLAAGWNYTVTEELDTEGTDKGFSTEQLERSGAIAAGKPSTASFTNTYSVTPLKIDAKGIFKGAKVLSGRDWLESDSFTFKIDSPVTKSPLPVDEEGKQVESVTLLGADHADAKADAEISFAFDGTVTFDKPGEYRYRIKEMSPSDGIAGISYSSASYRVIVTVTDNQEGGLSYTTKVEQTITDKGDRNDSAIEAKDGVATFTNTFTEATNDVNINAAKVWDDKSDKYDLAADMFEVELRPTGENAKNAPMPKGTTGEGLNRVAKVKNGPQGGFLFTIEFDNTMDGKTFTYELSETKGSLPGVNYDETSRYTVEFTVLVDDDNVVQLTRVYKDAKGQKLAEGVVPTFSNSYVPTSITLDETTAIKGSKTLTGRDMLTGRDGDESFTFTIAPTAETGKTGAVTMSGDATATVSGGKNGKPVDFSFEGITFTKPGTYTFNVSETAHNGEALPTDGTKGMTYDRHSCVVTVVVSDENNEGGKTGKLVIKSVSYDNGADKATDKAAFVNTYTASVDFGDKGGIEVSKTLSGRNMKALEFGFTITGVKSANVGAEDAANKLDEADKSFTNARDIAEGEAEVMSKLQGMTFTQADAGKTFSYEIAEVKGKLDRVTYDPTVWHVDLKPVDNGDGTMHVEVSYYKVSDGAESAETVSTADEGYKAITLPFVNSYEKKPAEVSEDAKNALTVSKQVVGAPTTDDFTFTLTLDENSDAGAVKGLDENRSAQVTINEDFANGDVKSESFGTLTFSKEDTYTFKVSENELDDKAGWTWADGDENAKTITVTVDDNDHDGQLRASVAGNNPVFVNTYAAKSVTLTEDQLFTVKKTVKGHDAAEDFTFTLSAVEDKGSDWTGMVNPGAEYASTITISKDGLTDGATQAASFGALTFTKTGTYKFEVVEDQAYRKEGDPKGWNYDEAKHTITVTVTDEGYDGYLDATVTYSDGEDATAASFTNTYTAGTAKLEGATKLAVEKTFTGRENDEWTDNDVFTFTLTGSEGAPMPEDAKENVATITLGKGDVTNRVAKGSFSDITYGDADRGKTYTYTIAETAGTVYGTTYSKAEYKVEVTVTDNNNGSLNIASTMTQVKDDAGNALDAAGVTAAKFTNTYKVSEPSKTVIATDGDKAEVNGKLVGVGDTLEYSIHWVNDAVNAKGEAVEAEVVVTDKVPVGTKVIEDSISSGGTLADGTITWELGKQKAAAEGDVSFQVKVTNEAAKVDEVKNTASVTVGKNDPKTTNTPTFEVPEKTVADSEGKNTSAAQVGDVLTYTIDYKNTTDEVATVIVTDTLSEGLAYQATSEGGEPEVEGQKLTWTIEGVQPGDPGKVSFTAKVTEDAVSQTVENSAAVQVGDNPAVSTNTVPVAVGSGNLTISKEIELTEGQGTTIDKNKEFTFTVTLMDAADVELSGEYDFSGTSDGAVEYNGTITNGDKVTLKHGGSIIIEGLPEGATYTVVEDSAAGYTPNFDNGTVTGSVSAEGAKAAFVNTYDAKAATGVPAKFALTKIFKGHKWTEDYEFTFKIEAVTEDAPMPEKDTAMVKGPQEDGKATFDFGGIKFTQAGTYMYTVSEVPGNNAGIEYASEPVTVKVEVTDDGNGKLVASAVVNGRFVNKYSTGEVAFDTAGGLSIVKNMTGRAIEAEDFTFTMVGADADSKAKFGGEEGKTVPTSGAKLDGEDGNVATEIIPMATGLTFTKDDAGKTYTYTVSEKNDDKPGVTYDPKATHTVEFVVSDGGNGVLKVDVYVDEAAEPSATYTGDKHALTDAVPVELVFNNSYDAGEVVVGDGAEASIEATKTLANHPLEDEMFSFTVTDKNGNTVATGTNDAAGNVTFSPIKYTTASLNKAFKDGSAAKSVEDGSTVYAFKYTVAEDRDSLPEGITASTASLGVTVKVTDDGKGHLSAKVVYDDAAQSLDFANVYGEGEGGTKPLQIKGNKVLDVVDGAGQGPDITGQFTFTLTGKDADDGTPAPMPEGAEGNTMTTTNAESGAVDFGEIVYTMENVFGTKASADDPDAQADEVEALQIESRTKTFIYTVTESGKMEGVHNDADTVKTMKVTVTDNGDGTISVDKTADEGASAGNDFTFTNTYEVKSTDSSLTGEGGITLTKKLAGRDMAEGEFTFQLVDSSTGEVVSTGKNDAEGNVVMSPITFDAEGDPHYILSEVHAGEEIDGVTYDADTYQAQAHVVDTGQGTLSVAWSVTDAESNIVEAVTFENSYQADPTSLQFNASKLLEGRELVEGEFTFELVEDGEVIATATNDAKGKIAFEATVYDEAGEHDYEIREVKGDVEGVTYDDTVFTYHVVVKDEGKGQLKATYEVGENGAPVFRNTYTAPAEPVEPEPIEPAEPEEKLPTTGDDSLLAVGGVGAAAVALIGAGLVLNRRKQR